MAWGTFGTQLFTTIVNQSSNVRRFIDYDYTSVKSPLFTANSLDADEHATQTAQKAATKDDLIYIDLALDLGLLHMLRLML